MCGLHGNCGTFYMNAELGNCANSDASPSLATVGYMIDELIAFVDMDSPPWTYSDALRERRQILTQLHAIKKAQADCHAIACQDASAQVRT